MGDGWQEVPPADEEAIRAAWAAHLQPGAEVHIPPPSRTWRGQDKANRVDTALKECAITVTKEAFEQSGEAKLMTWAECQRSAKALAGKTAFMQLSGGATLDHSRIVSIRVSGTCIFRPESKPSR
jgi:hypothetical protein